jgi:hypothetical protein
MSGGIMLAAHDHDMMSGKAKNTVFVTLGGRGSSTPIGGGLSFTYDFDRSPAMGTVIVKVRVFDRAGKRVTGLRITGDSGMPSMRGHHDSGEVPFRLSKKGDYLMPVNIVMPGTWEIKLRFRKGNDVIFKGRIEFDV